MWSEHSLLLPPRLLESQGCYQVFPCKGGWREAKADSLFLPLEKKKREKSILLLSLTNSVSPADQLPCVAVVSQVKSFMPLPLQFQATFTPFGLKFCHFKKICPFQKIPAASSCRCILPQGASRQVQPTLWGSCRGKLTSM